MKRINVVVGIALAVGVMLGVVRSRMLSAQDNLKAGQILQRMELKGAPGWEAILVERILPPGAEREAHPRRKRDCVCPGRLDHL
jgi:hypothetical protein